MNASNSKEAQENNSSKGKNTTSTSSSSISPWLRLKDPRVVRVSRAFGGKDRHSKVCTIRGLRDRRVRLSVPTAIQLYDLQDRLGVSQPSKVVDWLLENAKHEIDELPPLPISPENFGALINQQMVMAASQNADGTSSSSAANWEDQTRRISALWNNNNSESKEIWPKQEGNSFYNFGHFHGFGTNNVGEDQQQQQLHGFEVAPPLLSASSTLSLVCPPPSGGGATTTQAFFPNFHQMLSSSSENPVIPSGFYSNVRNSGNQEEKEHDYFPSRN